MLRAGQAACIKQLGRNQPPLAALQPYMTNDNCTARAAVKQGMMLVIQAHCCLPAGGTSVQARPSWRLPLSGHRLGAAWGGIQHKMTVNELQQVHLHSMCRTAPNGGRTLLPCAAGSLRSMRTWLARAAHTNSKQ